MSNSMSLKDVAQILGVKAYRIEYLLAHGLVPEPALRVSGRRIFDADDLANLKAHFASKLPGAEATAEPTTVGI